MFHKAVNLKFREGTTLEVRFQDGSVKQYDMKKMFAKYPQLKALENRKLFLTGRLVGFYGIVWNDILDIEVETIYQDGKTIARGKPVVNDDIGIEVATARAERGMSQKELAAATGIDQSDISRIERGVANPSVMTLKRIAEALGGTLNITIRL